MNLLKQGACLINFNLFLSVLSDFILDHSAAELFVDQLHAVADAQDWNAQTENVRVIPDMQKKDIIQTIKVYICEKRFFPGFRPELKNGYLGKKPQKTRKKRKS